MSTPNATSSPNDPSAADQARGKASEATEQAKDRAQQAAGQAQEKAQEAAGKARGVLRTQVDQRSTQAGEQTMTAANDVRSVGQQLREQGKGGPAKIADQAADRVERVGSYLRDSDADGILGDVEDFGRRNPWAIALGGLALGFAASRMLKASSSDRYQAGRSQYGGTPSYPTGNGMGTPASRTPDADVGGRAHTPLTEPHPAGTGPRTDRDVGGPTTPPGTTPGTGGATTGSTGVSPGTGPDFEPHR
ncbi:MAG TPA: hypothetical protein VK279_11345 [Solirubrobacteraceae bacterium]|nr:hypothetical protein [Solirubrobacteraceae bacterium]